MDFLNISSTGFKEDMNKVIQGGVGNDSITSDCIVKLTKVVRCNEDSEDKIPSLMLVFTNEKGETITDFRNFSGKTEEKFAKQVQAHVWTLNTLGAPPNIEELTEATKDGGKEAFVALFELFFEKFVEAGELNDPIGIEVDHDITAQRYVISRYTDAITAAGADTEGDDVPF